MTSITDLVNQIERGLLVHFTRPIYDVPSATFNTSVTTITLTNTDVLLQGSIINANFELMYVVAWNENTRTATVIRGFLGSTAASGTTATLLRINPPFSDIAISDAITDELSSWDERVFTVASEAVAFTAYDTSVAAAPTRAPYRLLDARPQPVGLHDVRTRIFPELRQVEPSGQFASTYSLHIDSPFGSAVTVDVLYALPFDTTGLTNSSSLEATHGLTAGLLEVLKWGALYRLVAGKESGRIDPSNFQRPDLAQAVPATAHLQAAQQYQQMRNLAYDREARKLIARWPIRFAR